MITETFRRGRETVAEGEKTASIGKMLAWGAVATVGIAGLAAGGAVILGGGLLAGGIFTAMAAGISAVGGKNLYTSLAAGLGIGKTVRGVGIMRQRAGNNAMARMLGANTDLHYYDTNHSRESENINALRHAISNRGEFFYPVTAMPGVEAEVMKTNLDLDQNRYQKFGTYLGGALSVFRDIATNPAGEMKQLILAAKK